MEKLGAGQAEEICSMRQSLSVPPPVGSISGEQPRIAGQSALPPGVDNHHIHAPGIKGFSYTGGEICSKIHAAWIWTWYNYFLVMLQPCAEI